MPTVLLATERFVELGEMVAGDLGMPDARIVAVPHPLGGTAVEVVESWADAVLDAVIGQIMGT